ncbi:MAG TPA: PqqD family protein [Bacteroidales bacterium]|nr:PqqD family protein [Bacteroidales bacterium]
MRLKKNIALSESGFVFDPSTGDSYSLNEQAQEIVKLMNENKSLDEISDHITAIYEIDKPGFEKYYYDFIGMLRQNQLLEEDE